MTIASDIGDKLQAFVKANMKKWAELEVLPEALSSAAALGLPRKFINNIAIEETADGVVLTNTWLGVNYHTGARDVPLAYFFEKGTKRDYPIEPKYADALHWIEAFTSTSILGTPGQDTKHHFAQKVIHPGFPPSEALAKAHKRGMKRMRKRVKYEVKEFLKRHNSKIKVEVKI